MFIRPGGVPAPGVDHTVNRVGADEVPGVNRSAGRRLRERIAFQTGGIDRLWTTVDDRRKHSGAGSIEEELVQFHAFLVFGLSSVVFPGFASGDSRASETVTGIVDRGRQDTVPGNIIEGADRLWCTAGDQSHQAGE